MRKPNTSAVESATNSSITRPVRPSSLPTRVSYQFVMRSKRRLNQPKKPRFSWWPCSTGLSIVAHRAGVSVSASRAENMIDTAIDIVNC